MLTIILVSVVILLLLISTVVFIVWKVKSRKCDIPKKEFSELEAENIAKQLGIDFATKDYKLNDFQKGLNVELEHGCRSPATNVTNDDFVKTGKIALAHLEESGKYYQLLEQMEKLFEEKKDKVYAK